MRDALALPVSAERFTAALLGWYDLHRRNLPWRRQNSPYRIWLAEVMLQQTRVEVVRRYYERFLQAFPTLADLAEAEEEAVLALWSGLGYYRRARHLHQAARLIVRDRGGEFPRTFQELIRLPGIGRYTAGAILSIAFEQPFPVLDGNVRRLFYRFLGLQRWSRAREEGLWKLLSDLVAEPAARSRVSHFNQALMELGALVCTPGRPSCEDCPLQTSCLAHRQGRQASVPPSPKGREQVRLEFVSALICRDQEYLLTQSRGESYLEGLWEFPRILGGKEQPLQERFSREQDLQVQVLEILPPVRHQITFRRLTFHPVVCRLLQPPPGRFRWSRLDQGAPPLPSYVLKIHKLRAALGP